MQRITVSKKAMRRAVIRSTKASAKLENRAVPSGFVRSAKVEQFLASRRSR